MLGSIIVTKTYKFMTKQSLHQQASRAMVEDASLDIVDIPKKSSIA